MSHTIEIPDDLYRALERYAARRGETAEAAIMKWVTSIAVPATNPTPDTMDGYAYNPADDPLAEFLGSGELTSPDAILRHDEALAAEALDAHEE